MAIPDGAGPNPPPPHTVHVHNVFGWMVARGPNGQKLLIMQDPTGEAHHFPLDHEHARELGAQLIAPGVQLPGSPG